MKKDFVTLTVNKREYTFSVGTASTIRNTRRYIKKSSGIDRNEIVL